MLGGFAHLGEDAPTQTKHCVSMLLMKTTREDRIDRHLNNLSERIDNRVSRIEDKIDREFKYLKQEIDSRNTYFEKRCEIGTDRLLSEIQRVQK